MSKRINSSNANSLLQFRCWDDKSQSFFYWGYDLNVAYTFVSPINSGFPSQQLVGIFKNGQKVFVGDIVEAATSKGLVKGEVVMDSYAFSIKINELLNNKKCGYDIGSKPAIFDVEIKKVLGNIFQNPELLK